MNHLKMKSLVTLIVLGYQFIQIRAWSLWPFGNGNLQRSKRSAELECADGFFQLPGHRMEEVDPIFGSQWMIPYEQCVAMCDLIQKDTSTCCSYEWSPKGDVCNLHQLCQAKDDKDHNDFVFCRRVADSSEGVVVSRECGGGFEFLAGHRMADVDPTFGMQWNITRGQCSSMCDNIQNESEATGLGCCSYEWSPTGMRCNLHTSCQGQKEHKNDFIFCRRGSPDAENIEVSTLNPDAAKHADIHVAHKGHVDHDAHPHVGKAIQAIHVGLTARNLVDVSLEAARAVLDEIYEISGHANGANGTPEDRTFFLPEVECGVNFVAIAGQSSQDVDPLLGSKTNVTHARCAWLCDEVQRYTTKCCSYEWSPEGDGVCNLHPSCLSKEKAPAKKNFNFCRRANVN